MKKPVKNIKKILVNIFLLGSILICINAKAQGIIKRSPEQRKDWANVFYNSTYTLFDMWSDEPIFHDSDGIYTIYTATNEKKIPRLLTGNSYVIASSITYKFKNYSNCQNWCEGKTFSPEIVKNQQETNSENITIQNYKSAQIRLRDKTIDGTINNIDQYAFIRHDYNNNQIEISTKYDHYKGGFINGKKNGIAIYESKGNFVYEGEFKDNEITGNGLMTFPGDETYKGDFINGNRNGKGIFIWKSGISYNGGWKNGLSHGYGLQTNPDGSKLYEGAYYKGQYHGFGVLYTANGSRTGGIWQTGNLLYSLPEFVNNPKFYDFDIEYGYTSFDFDVFCVSFNSKKGVINIKGKEIIPCKYDVFEFNTVGYEKRIVGRIFSSDLKDVYDYNGNYFGNKSHNADIEKVNRQREITANKIKSQEKLSSKSSANSELNPALMSLLASAVFLGGETERSKSASRTSSGSSKSNSNSQKVCSSCKPSDDKGWYISDYDANKKIHINGRYVKNIGHKPCSRCHGTANCKAYNTCSSVFNNESNSCLQCKGDRFTECDWCKGTGYER